MGLDVFLRYDIYYPVIDKTITELNDRFSENITSHPGINVR